MENFLIFLIYIIIGILAGHKVAETNNDKPFLPFLVCIAWPVICYIYIGIFINMLFLDDNKSNPLLSLLVYICWPILIIIVLILYIIKKIIK